MLVSEGPPWLLCGCRTVGGGRERSGSHQRGPGEMLTPLIRGPLVQWWVVLQMWDVYFGDELREPEKKRRYPTKHSDNKVGRVENFKGKNERNY